MAKRMTALEKAKAEINHLRDQYDTAIAEMKQSEIRTQEYKNTLDTLVTIVRGTRGYGSSGFSYEDLQIHVLRAIDLARKYECTLPEESRTVQELRGVIKWLINPETTLPPRCDIPHNRN